MFLGAFAGAFAGVIIAPVLVPVIEAVAKPITTAAIAVAGSIVYYIQQKRKTHKTPEPQFINI